MRFGYLMQRLGRTLRGAPGNYLLTLCALTVTFLALTVTLLVLGNAQSLPVVAERPAPLTLLLDPAAADGEIQALQMMLESQSKLQEVTLLSPDSVRERVLSEAGVDATETLKALPFPAALSVDAIALAPAEKAALVEKLWRFDAVKDVIESEAKVESDAGGLRPVLLVVAAVLTLLLALGVVSTLSNTTRLAYREQAQEVALARYFGASERFVRRPFVVDAMLRAAVAALMAVVGTGVVWFGVRDRFVPLFGSVDWQFLSLPAVLALVVFAVSLGWLGAQLPLWRSARPEGGLATGFSA